jgi:hypothetical protein
MTAAARARLHASRRRPLTPFVLTTEIVEPGVPIAAAEQEGLIEALCGYVRAARRGGGGGSGVGGGAVSIGAVAVMGSLPTGVAPGYYAKVNLNGD